MSDSKQSKTSKLANMLVNWALDLSSMSNFHVKQGCLISNYSMNKVLSMGWRGGGKKLPTALKGFSQDSDGLVSAATNAMLFVKEKESGMCMFLTYPPTEQEVLQIINFGIFEIYYIGDSIDDKSLKLLKSAKIRVVNVIRRNTSQEQS